MVVVHHHAIEQYKDRVTADTLRYSRTDSGIRGILEDAVNHADIPDKISGRFHLLCVLEDQFRNQTIGPYYLVIERTRDDIAVKTIKLPFVPTKEGLGLIPRRKRPRYQEPVFV